MAVAWPAALDSLACLNCSRRHELCLTIWHAMGKECHEEKEERKVVMAASVSASPAQGVAGLIITM